MKLVDAIALECGGPGSGPHKGLHTVVMEHGYQKDPTGTYSKTGNDETHVVETKKTGDWSHTKTIGYDWRTGKSSVRIKRGIGVDALNKHLIKQHGNADNGWKWRH